MAAKIRRDDEVIVLAGKDKGKRGKVLSVVAESGRVFVEGINLIKKHQKPVPQLNQAGGIVEKEASLHVSNLLVVQGGNTSRLGYRFLEDGSKVRILKKTNEESEIQ